MSLQLGWYRQIDNRPVGFVHLRFVVDDVINPTVMYQAKNLIHCVNARWFGDNYEYVGTILETWVPADPSKITLEMLPMKARFRDHEEQSWDEGILVGFCEDQFLDGDETPRPFEYWKLCEVIHCEVIQ